MTIIEDLVLQKLFRLYKRDSLKYRILRPEQEHELGLRILKGDKSAADYLVLANLRFVVAKARKEFDRQVSFLDLIAEGNRGLISAASKFDTTRGFRFVTFAAWDVKQNMRVAKRKAPIINVPSAKLKLKEQVLKAIDAFQFEHHREPSEIELSELIGLSPQMIAECLKYNATVYSTAGMHEGAEFMDLSLNAEQQLIVEADFAIADEMVKRLNERERYIIEGFYGLNMPKRLSYKEMGAHLNITSERVRQLKREAMVKLRRKRKLLCN